MFMHHTVTVTHIHWRRMVSLERRLYARAFREGESLRLQQSAAGPAESDDWRADLENEVSFAHWGEVRWTSMGNSQGRSGPQGRRYALF